MEMNIRYRHPMGVAFRLRNQTIDGHHIVLDPVGEGQMIAHDMLDITQPAMRMAVTMVVVVIMSVFLFRMMVWSR